MTHQPITAQALEEELNLIAEYGGSTIEFAVEETSKGQGLVTWGSQSMEVNLAFCYGNARRLPDRHPAYAIPLIVGLSQPHVMLVGPDNNEGLRALKAAADH